MTRVGILGILGLAACQPSHLKDARTPTGSATVAADRSYESLYTVHPYDGLVSRATLAGESWELDLPGEPTRIAPLGDDRMVVTLRASRSIGILTLTDGAPELERELEVGAEPYGVVTTEDGSRIYVALSQEDRVVEYDGETFEALRSWRTPDDPRWLALHPSEQSLFVACGYEASLVRLDLRDDIDEDSPDAVEELDLPHVEREFEDDAWVDLTPRWTGDPSITAAGDAIFVPGLYVDNESGSTSSVSSAGSGTGTSSGYYMATATGISRTNPVVVGYLLDWKTGEVFDESDPTAIFLAGTVGARGFENVRSYPSSVTVAPGGDTAMVTMEASDAVALLHLEPARGQGDARRISDTLFDPDVGSDGAPFTSIDEGGLYERPVVMLDAPAGPNGVAFVADDDAWVFGAVDRELGSGRFGNALREVEKLSEEMASGFFTAPELSVSQRRVVAESRLDPDVEDGRRLFFSAVNPVMAGSGAGVSCSTCHFEGRNDGLTWALDGGPLQTPSLAGDVTATAPVTWTETVESVAHEAQLTSEIRMGGAGLSFADAAKIQAFVDSTRDVDVADKGRDDAVVQLGREVFARPEVGCADCHQADNGFTDNQAHPLYGLPRVNTPSLVGVAATAPYLHDGSAATLRAVLETAQTGAMGDTSSLTDDEIDALVTYLKTL